MNKFNSFRKNNNTYPNIMLSYNIANARPFAHFTVYYLQIIMYNVYRKRFPFVQIFQWELRCLFGYKKIACDAFLSVAYALSFCVWQ